MRNGYPQWVPILFCLGRLSYKIKERLRISLNGNRWRIYFPETLLWSCQRPVPFDGTGLRVGVVVSRFNGVITERLLAGTAEALSQHGVEEEHIEVVRVPGAFEIPQSAKLLAASGRFDAVVCLGALVRGETPHFEYIAMTVVDEIERLALAYDVPMTLGVLTTNTVEQGLVRSGAGPGNKGYEAAVSAIEMANLHRILSRDG